MSSVGGQKLKTVFDKVLNILDVKLRCVESKYKHNL